MQIYVFISSRIVAFFPQYRRGKEEKKEREIGFGKISNIAGILRDKTMKDKLIYIPNDNK